MWLSQARAWPSLPLRRGVEAGRNDAERIDVILAAGDGRADDAVSPTSKTIACARPGTAPAATRSSPPRALAG